MNDEQRPGQALEISWSEPSAHAGTGAWDGPAPHADNDSHGYDQSFLDEPVEAAPAAQSSTTRHDDVESAAHKSAPEQPAPANPPRVVDHHTEVPDDAVTIGRSRSNVIVLDDMLVSRRHVVLTADENGLLLRDLGSRNGTFVNGTRVEATHINEGDRIGIGASTFEVRDGWLVSV